MPSHILVFVHSATCGHSRRMDSIVDHFLRANRDLLKVAKVEISERADLAARFGVTSAPTLLLLEDLREVARLDGRRTLPEMKDAFEHFLQRDLTGEVPVELAAC